MLYRLSYTPRCRHARARDMPEAAAAARRYRRSPSAGARGCASSAGRSPAGRGRGPAGSAARRIALEQQAGEHAGADRPGVDGDPVGVVLDRRHDGVAVHHLEAEVGGRGQEGLADPDQVVARPGRRAARRAGCRRGRRGSRRSGSSSSQAARKARCSAGRRRRRRRGSPPGRLRRRVGHAVGGERGVAAHVLASQW